MFLVINEIYFIYYIYFFFTESSCINNKWHDTLEIKFFLIGQGKISNNSSIDSFPSTSTSSLNFTQQSLFLIFFLHIKYQSNIQINFLLFIHWIINLFPLNILHESLDQCIYISQMIILHIKILNSYQNEEYKIFVASPWNMQQTFPIPEKPRIQYSYSFSLVSFSVVDEYRISFASISTLTFINFLLTFRLTLFQILNVLLQIFALLLYMPHPIAL